MACHYPKGTCGGSLHAAPRTSAGGAGGYQYEGSAVPLLGAATGYSLTNGRFYSEGVNVSWQLDGATGSDGGFVCIPGGHKARLPYEGGDALSIDHPLVTHIEVGAGDVLVFNARSTPHGVLAWRGESERRCVIQFNNAANAQLTPGQELGTASRNTAQQNGGLQAPPGWDLTEGQFETMVRDLGLEDEEGYLEYKRGEGFGRHLSAAAKARL
jgi:hypothetical protein